MANLAPANRLRLGLFIAVGNALASATKALHYVMIAL
jgi:hypothetical protein